MYRVITTILIFSSGTAVLLWVSMEKNKEFEMLMWAASILWLNIIPIIHYLIVGRRQELFPYIPILGLNLKIN